jgi:hypothetical protein
MKSVNWIVNNEIFGHKHKSSTGIVGSGVNGGAFITNITPTGAGNVGGKTFSSDGVVLATCLSDTQLVTVAILGITGNSSYKPNIVLRWGTHFMSVPMIAGPDKPLFSGSIAINLDGATSMLVEHEDGASHICHILTDAPPVISSANFVGGYPGVQTELKAGDTYQFNVVADIPFVAVEFANAGAYTAQSFPVAATANATVTGIIADRGTVVQNLGASVRVRKSTGSWSAWHLTASDGSADEVNIVKLNNLYPTVTCGAITYPLTQSALKDAETASVVNTVLNHTTVAYTSPNGELSIAAPAVAGTPKVVTRIGGTYNVSVNNLRISANRAANNATTFAQTIVQIAHVAATLSITEPAARLRSGGNNGTVAQNHVITITANQNITVPPTLNAGAQGTWQGAGFVGAGMIWTRSLQVHDNMTKGTYAWGSISATNLAGIITSVITGNADYVLGGFVSRVLTLPAYTNVVNMNVEASTYANVAMTWSVKALPNKRAVGAVATPDANSWCLHTLLTNPTIVRILDTAATGASSSPSTITIQETV